jgi:hypothetical protein
MTDINNVLMSDSSHVIVDRHGTGRLLIIFDTILGFSIRNGTPINGKIK